MKLFIVAVPLFNANMTVQAYDLRYHNSEKLFGMTQSYESFDGATYSPGIDLLNLIGIEPFTGGKPIFVPINKFLLLSDFYQSCKIPCEQMVCSLSTDITTEPIYFEKAKELKTLGYQICLTNRSYKSDFTDFFNLAEYYVIDTSKGDHVNEIKLIQNKFPRIRLILTNIKDKTHFNILKIVPRALYEGMFYNQPITKGVNKISPIKANSIQLLRIVQSEDFEMDDVVDILEKDAALSISLLKFINSPAIGLTSSVRSINHAVAMLGQIETRKWIVAAVSAYLADDKPNEITKLSLTRAKFAENLAHYFEIKSDEHSLFLMGLFSLIDVILDMPMDLALKEIAVAPSIHAALTNQEGKFLDILNLIKSYERANWEKVSYILLLNNINTESLNKAFVDSMLWYKELLEGIDGQQQDDTPNNT